MKNSIEYNQLSKKFEQIGARLKFVERSKNRFAKTSGVSLDIGTDRKGEYFEITPDESLMLKC